jgi:hypothetical protein
MKGRVTPVMISGVLAVVVCVALTLVAHAHYPASFSPRANWLSDLTGPRIRGASARDQQLLLRPSDGFRLLHHR